jgi:hypothetical protein
LAIFRPQQPAQDLGVAFAVDRDDRTGCGLDVVETRRPGLPLAPVPRRCQFRGAWREAWKTDMFTFDSADAIRNRAPTARNGRATARWRNAVHSRAVCP